MVGAFPKVCASFPSSPSPRSRAEKGAARAVGARGLPCTTPPRHHLRSAAYYSNLAADSIPGPSSLRTLSYVSRLRPLGALASSCWSSGVWPSEASAVGSPPAKTLEKKKKISFFSRGKIFQIGEANRITLEARGAARGPLVKRRRWCGDGTGGRASQVERRHEAHEGEARPLLDVEVARLHGRDFTKAEGVLGLREL